MRLTVVLPGFEEHVEAVRQESAGWAHAGTTTVDVVAARVPQDWAGSDTGVDLASRALLGEVERAVRGGSDGVFIDCFADPAVRAARERVDVPVVGGFQPAVHTAMLLGERVGVLTTLPGAGPVLDGLIRREGLAGRCRVLFPPDGRGEEAGDLAYPFRAAAATALAEGTVDVLVPGCTGFPGLAGAVREELAGRGSRMPVVDPTAAAVTTLEGLVRQGLGASRTGSPQP